MVGRRVGTGGAGAREVGRAEGEGQRRREETTKQEAGDRKPKRAEGGHTGEGGWNGREADKRNKAGVRKPWGCDRVV